VPNVLLGMGERGLFTRVLAPKLGSRLGYARPPEQPAEASALPDLDSLLELYRFRGIDERTQVCGVLGNPIAHSRSPQIHNRGYAALGLNAVYLPFLADAEEAESFFELADSLELAGFSVTMPFKERVLPLLDEQDPAVRVIGARDAGPARTRTRPASSRPCSAGSLPCWPAGRGCWCLGPAARPARWATRWSGGASGR